MRKAIIAIACIAIIVILGIMAIRNYAGGSSTTKYKIACISGIDEFKTNNNSLKAITIQPNNKNMDKVIDMYSKRLEEIDNIKTTNKNGEVEKSNSSDKTSLIDYSLKYTEDNNNLTYFEYNKEEREKSAKLTSNNLGQYLKEKSTEFIKDWPIKLQDNTEYVLDYSEEDDENIFIRRKYKGNIILFQNRINNYGGITIIHTDKTILGFNYEHDFEVISESPYSKKVRINDINDIEDALYDYMNKNQYTVSEYEIRDINIVYYTDERVDDISDAIELNSTIQVSTYNSRNACMEEWYIDISTGEMV